MIEGCPLRHGQGKICNWAYAVIPEGTFTKNKVRYPNPSSQLDALGAFVYSENGFSSGSLPSDLTGGASGGPWLSNLSSGLVSSVNSYKYTNDALRMYGPKFGVKTTATFNAARAATGSTDVIVRN